MFTPSFRENKAKYWVKIQWNYVWE